MSWIHKQQLLSIHQPSLKAELIYQQMEILCIVKYNTWLASEQLTIISTKCEKPQKSHVYINNDKNNNQHGLFTLSAYTVVLSTSTMKIMKWYCTWIYTTYNIHKFNTKLTRSKQVFFRATLHQVLMWKMIKHITNFPSCRLLTNPTLRLVAV